MGKNKKGKGRGGPKQPGSDGAECGAVGGPPAPQGPGNQPPAQAQQQPVGGQAVQPPSGGQQQQQQGRPQRATGGAQPAWGPRSAAQPQQQQQQQPRPQGASGGAQPAWGPRPGVQATEQAPVRQQGPPAAPQVAAKPGPEPETEQLKEVTKSTSQLAIAEPAGAGDRGAVAAEKDPDSAWIMTAKDRAIFETEFPAKPPPGNIGKVVKLQMNHYPIKMPSNVRIVMYDVSIKPVLDPKSKNKKAPEQLKSKKVCRAIWKEYMAKYGKEMKGLIPAYDGFKIARVVAPGLPDSEREVSYKEDDDVDPARTFVVTMKRAGESDIDLKDIMEYATGRRKEPPLEAIAAVNAFFAHMPSMLHLTVGRRFLYDNYQDDLGGAKVARYGFTMSVREGDKQGWTLHLCVNSVAGVFAKAGNAATLAAELLGCRNPGEILQRRNLMQVRRDLKEHFNRLRVKMTHTGRKKGITGVSKKAARDIMFMHGDGPEAKQMSLPEYYRLTYKVNLRFVDLPCFNVGPIERNTYIPMELCEVLPNQSRLGQLSEKQTTQLLNAMTMSPNDRFNYIAKDVARFAKESDPLLKQLGMQIDANQQNVSGRVIPAPDIHYSQNQIAKPSVGSWRADRQKFLSSRSGAGGGIPWGCAWSNNCGVPGPDVGRFANELMMQAKKTGLELGSPVNVGPIRHPLELKDNDKVKGLALLVVVLPDNRDNPGGFREDLKRMAETKQYGFGWMTQCVRPQHFRAPPGKTANAFNNMYLGNLLLKINTKLGGVNCAPRIDPMVMQYIKSSGTLIIGADVTHAPPGSAHPSVAAVLGSVDLIGVRYTAHVRVQKVREEFIEDMKGVMLNCLRKYRASNGGRRPERILFFRDGVGEGAFKKVRSYEIAKIQEACKALEPGYEPLITFVIVQKRHQTRFKPTDNNCTRSGNVLPGTVVDTTITSPILFDFYLVSHEGIKGTSRPTHYWVVWDDNRFTQNGLQALTYYLCHCYSRCNRSVSIPAATYYAHHVATRAKGYIKDKLNSDSTTVASGSSGDSGGFDLSDLNRAVELHAGIESSMFFV